MPYPLPDDPESVTNLAWKLIAIPDDPAYSRAALDRYSGISDVWNWGLDGVEPGSHVARQSWLTAVLATLELWDMNPLETIISLIDLVETLLEQIRDGQCCDGVVGDPIADMRTDDWSTGDDVPVNVVSAGFASSSSDQDGYDDYKCVVANVAVQDLIEKVTRAATYIDAGGKLVGGIAAIAALLAFVFAGPALTSLTALSLGIVGATGAAAVLFAFFSDAGKVNVEAIASDLTDAYSDLVCAIYTADGNEDAKDALAAELEATVGATAAAAIRIISDMVIDALYAGRYDATNTAQALSDAGFDGTEFDCGGCLAPPEALGVYRRALVHVVLDHDDACAGVSESEELYTNTLYSWGGNVAGAMTADFYNAPTGGARAELEIVVVSAYATATGNWKTWDDTLTLQTDTAHGTGDVTATLAGAYSNVSRMQANTGMRCALDGYIVFYITGLSA